MSALNVKLEAFEGPLDLLLHLIEKNKVDIYDIPIADITDQYIEYIENMRDGLMDVMSDFLVMAATLLRIKSAMLLPKQEDEQDGEEDPRLELTNRLIEYKMYKYAAGELKELQADAAGRVFRKEMLPEEVAQYKEPIDPKEVLGDTTLELLNRLFNDMIKRNANKIDPIRSGFGKITKEEVDFSDKVRKIQEYGIKHKKFSFKRLINNPGSKVEIIVTFLGILELIKMGRVTIVQEKIFDDIEVEFHADDIVAVEQYS